MQNHISGFGMKKKIVDTIFTLRASLFPSIYEKDTTNHAFLQTVVNRRLCEAAISLRTNIEEVLRNICERENKGANDCTVCSDRADAITQAFMSKLGDIREKLSSDIEAAYNGDPAARYFEEIVLSYPSIEAVTIQRMAHELYLLGVPLIPRIMTEYGHATTGIDIHPGAQIGDHFFIDHGTGVVIGETCVIGNNVKLYQGVTLGAKSFELDADGNPVKGIKRHPNIEDRVIVYSGATILGGDTTIGHDSVIGGNVWLTQSVPPYSKVYQPPFDPVIKPGSL
nr:serine O-acetyltransferase EpsC [Feifania hominis]